MVVYFSRSVAAQGTISTLLLKDKLLDALPSFAFQVFLIGTETEIFEETIPECVTQRIVVVHDDAHFSGSIASFDLSL